MYILYPTRCQEWAEACGLLFASKKLTTDAVIDKSKIEIPYIPCCQKCMDYLKLYIEEQHIKINGFAHWHNCDLILQDGAKKSFF